MNINRLFFIMSAILVINGCSGSPNKTTRRRPSANLTPPKMIVVKTRSSEPSKGSAKLTRESPRINRTKSIRGRTSPKTRQRIAILDLKNDGHLDESSITYLSNLIRQTSSQLPNEQYSVVTKDNILVMLPPKMKLEDCQGTCAVDTGRKLGVHWIIVGEVIKFEDELRVSLNLHHTETGELRSSESVKGKTLKDLELPLQGTSLMLLSVLEPNLKKSAERLKRGFAFQKFDYAEIPDLTAQMQPLDKMDTPQVEVPLPEASSIVKGVDFGNVNVETLELYDQAVTTDKDPTQTPEAKIKLWEVVASSAPEFKQEAQNRISEWRRYVEQLKAQKEAELKRRKELEEKRRIAIDKLNLILKADQELEKRRQVQMKEDYSKLSRLLTLSVISDEDKLSWVEAFLESYGAVDGLNPHLDSLRVWINKLGATFRKMRSKSKLDFEEKSKRRAQIMSQLDHLNNKTDNADRKVTGHSTPVASLHRKSSKGANRVSTHLDWARIPRGSFTIGLPESDLQNWSKSSLDYSDFFKNSSKIDLRPSTPSRKIDVDGFLMSVTEVTVYQYRQCVRAKSCMFVPPKGCRVNTSDLMPMNCVTQEQAQEFAEWVGGRLPTEAEWEYAALGNQSFNFAGSDDAEKVGWVSTNADERPHFVSQKQPNDFGLYDMTGNLWELTSSPFVSYKLIPSKADLLPLLPDVRNVTVRGGSWTPLDSSLNLIKERLGLPSVEPRSNVGFRVVSDLLPYIAPIVIKTKSFWIDKTNKQLNISMIIATESKLAHDQFKLQKEKITQQIEERITSLSSQNLRRTIYSIIRNLIRQVPIESDFQIVKVSCAPISCDYQPIPEHPKKLKLKQSSDGQILGGIIGVLSFIMFFAIAM